MRDEEKVSYERKYWNKSLTLTIEDVQEMVDYLHAEVLRDNSGQKSRFMVKGGGDCEVLDTNNWSEYATFMKWQSRIAFHVINVYSDNSEFYVKTSFQMGKWWSLPYIRIEAKVADMYSLQALDSYLSQKRRQASTWNGFLHSYLFAAIVWMLSWGLVSYFMAVLPWQGCGLCDILVLLLLSVTIFVTSAAFALLVKFIAYRHFPNIVFQLDFRKRTGYEFYPVLKSLGYVVAAGFISSLSFYLFSTQLLK